MCRCICINMWQMWPDAPSLNGALLPVLHWLAMVDQRHDVACEPYAVPGKLLAFYNDSEKRFCNLRSCPYRETLIRCVRLGSNLRYFAASVAFTRPCDQWPYLHAKVRVTVELDIQHVHLLQCLLHMTAVGYRFVNNWRWECNTTGCKCTHSNNPDRKLDHDLSGQVLNFDWRARCWHNTRQSAIKF